MIDTHTHLYLPEDFPGDEGRLAVERAFGAGVEELIFPGIYTESVPQMRALQRQFPGRIHVALGLHPTELTDTWRDDLKALRPLMEAGDVVAVGEIGIDLYWSREHRDRQIEAFREQTAIAAELGLPVIIHCREGLDETLQVISGLKAQDKCPRLLFHSFTYGPDEVKRIRAVDPEAMFGINGVATFKSAANVREAVSEIGAEHILLETDSPYLAPVPYRGRRNESAYLPATAAKVAEVLGLTAAEVDRITTGNARKFFRLK